MGACTSKARQTKENYLAKDPSAAGNNKKKSSLHEQSSLINVDQFANVPFIDSEEKLASTPPMTPTIDNDEQTTVKNDFETNVSYSNAETIGKLKQEVVTFVRERILPHVDEKQKLVDYVHKRIIGSPAERRLIDEHLDACFADISAHRPPDMDERNKIRTRLMHVITVYVASQASDNSFLKALYDKMGASLDLNTLNAETNEHEVVHVTVTKRVRQVFLDGSSSVIPTDRTCPVNTVIHLSNHEPNIPADLPDDIRRKAEQVLHSFNDAIRSKQ